MSDRSIPVSSFVLDPMVYLCRVTERDDSGRARKLEVFYDEDVIHLEDHDEFVTVRTQVLLEERAGKK